MPKWLAEKFADMLLRNMGSVGFSLKSYNRSYREGVEVKQVGGGKDY